VQVVSRATDALVAQLLERLAGVPDISDACSILLDQTVAEGRFGRAVVVLRTDTNYHWAGWGLAEEQLEALRRDALEAEWRVSELLERTAPAVVAPEAALPRLDFAAVALLPFTGVDGVPLGAVLLEAAALDERVELVSEVFQRCGPMLERILQVSTLRARVAKLDRQRDLLTGIINGLPDPVILTNQQNDILLANDRADQLFGGGADASEGRRRAVSINNLLFSSFLTQAAITSEPVGTRELNLVDPGDGSDLLFEILSVPLPSSVVGEGAAISILRDITDLKRAVAELEAEFGRSRAAEHRARRERDQLNVVLENVGDPILVTDDQSNIILMNPEADRLFVVPAGANEQARNWRLVRANDTKFTTLISDFLLQVSQRRVEKLDLADPTTGREFPVEVISSKILNNRGEPTAIVSVVHDLTQVAENQRLAGELQDLNDDLEDRIRRATEELEEHNRRLEWQSQELEKASRLKSEFLANMSHELRTPINVILGYTSLSRERIYGELTHQQDEALEKIYDTSQHLLELINDILDLSKIEAGKMPLHLEDVRPDDLLEELSRTVQAMVSKKGITFRTELTGDLPTLVTDRMKLKQVLLNLLSNAIKFTHEGTVSIRAARIPGGERVRVEVADTGIGIRPEHLEAIFEDFRQADQSHTREYGGTGLGLSITKKLLTLLGGTITVESTYQVGSTFIIELPIRIVARSGDEMIQRLPRGRPAGTA
jgi:PAS domain S-box-containing protein